ncbi:mRNA degradation [Hyphodiscus hymeniophilus]|uniref:mRNA degradation n=1 Tax=Hyphodiscus hymeniophilus TaxID=353542 RepID=A0A9P7AWU4_9HELO|nr:mRNA degradation [Hyphodiscus hymeniophilus]
MFLSITRGSTKIRPTYICTSCLAHLLPHPDPPPAHSNRTSFSTSSVYREADKKHSSNATSSVRTRSRAVRRRGRPVRRISDSGDALILLKESLAAEEAASKDAKSQKPKPKPKSKKANPVTEAEETIVSAKPRQQTGVGEKVAKRNRTSTVKGEKATEVTNTSQVTEQEPAMSERPKKSSKLVKKGASTTKETTAQNVAAKLAEKPPGPSKRSKTRQLTAAQRQRVDAVLLEAKRKLSAVLSKTKSSQTQLHGENNTTEALVKIIEEGISPKSDGARAAKRTLSKLINESSRVRSNKRPLILNPITREKLVRMKPNIRAVFPKTPVSPTPPMVTQSLKEALEASRKTQATAGRTTRRRTILTRALPRRSTRAPIGKVQGKAIPTGPLVGKAGFEIKTLDAADLVLTPIDIKQPPVPNLAYGLDRVLFNPGVYHLQDPRSRVFNFDPYLQTIMPVEEFDFTALKKYITSSRDDVLLSVAKEEGKKYTGSTSSMTAALAHFHFLLSQWRPINTALLSQDFPAENQNFTGLQRGPSAVFLRWKDGVYAIDADKQFDSANILASLGKSMEKLLTLPTEDFEKYRKENSDQIPLEEREAPEPFNYTTMGDFLMRSQLDAHDPRLPGTGMFDLKTRAVISIRMDVANYEEGKHYEIRGRYGAYESFEREYYDLIRAAFLKYSLQVRMGRMDGIFVAYHNTQRIFGFQYISQPEMDLALHGTEDTTIGDAEFKLSVELLNKVLDKASAKYPEKSLRLHFETRNTETPFMYIFAEPMEDEEIKGIQESNKAVIEEFENRVLGVSGEDTEEMSEEDKRAAEWDNMRAQVEKTMEKDELDLEEARSLAESMIDESNIFGSEDIPAEEKERLINDLLESSAFNEVEEEEEMGSSEDVISEEDGIEGVSADSEGDDLEEGEEDLEEEDGEDPRNEEDEQNAEDEEEPDEESGEEELEELDPAEESETLGHAEDKDLLVDEAPTSDFTRESENPEQTNGEGILVEETPADPLAEELTDNVTEGSESKSLDAPAGPPESVEFLDSISETETDAASHQPDVVENKGLAPSDEALRSDSQDIDTHAPAPADADPVADADRLASNETEGTFPDQPSILKEKDILAMTLTIRNKVNGKYVLRPDEICSQDQWTIEYALEDVAPHRAGTLYQACKTRRAKTLNKVKKDNDGWNKRFVQNLLDLNEKGKKWREEQNKMDKKRPLEVLHSSKPKADQSAWAGKEDGHNKPGVDDKA